jgi:plastocyanin
MSKTAGWTRRGLAAGVLSLAVVQGVAATRLFSIEIKNLAFGSQPRGLRVGDTVRWVNRDIFRHSATAAGLFDVDMAPGASGAVVLTRAGVFNYVCRYHPGMKGQLTVTR